MNPLSRSDGANYKKERSRLFDFSRPALRYDQPVGKTIRRLLSPLKFQPRERRNQTL